MFIFKEYFDNLDFYLFLLITALCLIELRTLGVPVEPDVYMTIAVSSGVTCSVIVAHFVVFDD